ncbi:MAG TPA: phosphatase PAP2 family protein [Allosphingosinicella sp.]|nr:phosphatase PAP2 family protein [Allosphingosinicella sp.]
MTKKKRPADEGAEALLAADAATLDAVAPYRRTLPVRALSTFSKLGDQPPLRILCASMIAAGLGGGNRRLALAGARAIAAHSLATGAKNFVKHRIDRTRPQARGNGSGSHKPKKGRQRSKQETSFPSGHSAGAAAVARAFARDYPEYEAAALGAAGLVALAQIPRCAHYPTDVGAGLAIGIAAEAVTDFAWNRLANGRRGRGLSPGG